VAAYTVPSANDLAALAAAHGLREVAITPVRRGTVNSSFRLDAASGQLFLRIYEEQGREGAEREVDLLTHLAARGARTPGPRLALDGRAVLEIAGKPAVLFPFIHGDMRCQEAVTPAVARAVGAEVARLNVAARGARPHPCRFDDAQLGRRVDVIAASPLRELAGPLRDGLERIRRARRRDLPSGMIHGDVFRDNVLWDVDAPSAILDFESAGLGAFAYDLAVVILAWTYTDRFEPALMRGVVAGYESVRPLERDEEAGLFDELCFGALRFTITRVTDCALRGDTRKDHRRFQARLEALEAMGRRGLSEMLGLPGSPSRT
jgi:homoserine kinase type II